LIRVVERDSEKEREIGRRDDDSRWGRSAEKRKGEPEEGRDREREKDTKRSSLHPLALYYRCGYIGFAVPILKRAQGLFLRVGERCLISD